MAVRMSQKGQAAVTDTLYFLLIVTGLCAFLFIFANQYGLSVSEQISRQYYSTYASSALKTILYSSTPRDPGESLYDSDAEIDHLLAVMKEDYADDQLLTDDTKKTIANNILNIMGPVAMSFDYVLYVFQPGATPREVVFTMVHVSRFGELQPVSGQRGFVRAELPETAHADFVCGNANYDALQRLLINVGSVSMSSSKMELLFQPADPSKEAKQIMAQVDLAMWPATVSPPGIFDPEQPPGSWGCEELS